jgi:hypothetical protein
MSLDALPTDGQPTHPPVSEGQRKVAIDDVQADEGCEEDSFPDS